MQNHKIFDILKLLKSAEIKKFKKFCDSPYFTSNKKVFILCKYLMQFYPNFESDKLKAEYIYSKIYLKKPYNRQILFNLFSEFYNTAEKYLVTEQLENSSSDRMLLLIRNLTRRENVKLSLKYIGKELSDLENTGISTMQKHKKRAELLDERTSTLDYTSDHEDYLYSETLKSESIAYSSVLNILDIAGNIFSYSFYFHNYAKNPLFNELLLSIDVEKLITKTDELSENDSLLLEINLYGYRALYGKNKVNDYKKLKELIVANIHRYNIEDKYHLWDICTKILDYSLCNIMPCYLTELHELNKFFIDNNSFVSGNIIKIDDNNLRSIFSTAIHINEWDWAEWFINNYHIYLPAELKDNSYNYLAGQCKMNSGNFEKAIEHFSKVKMKDIVINIDIRVFYIECLYELNYWSELTSAIDSFKHYIMYNKKEVNKIIKNYNPFFRYIVLLIKHKSSNIKPDSFIIDKLTNTKECYEKAWLLKKFNELMLINKT